jgi:hypothetical protein
MGDVVNLKNARKGKARAAAEAKAQANRAAFGRTKAEKQFSRAEREAADRKLDGHRRDDDTDDDDQ